MLAEITELEFEAWHSNSRIPILYQDARLYLFVWNFFMLLHTGSLESMVEF